MNVLNYDLKSPMMDSLESFEEAINGFLDEYSRNSTIALSKIDRIVAYNSCLFQFNYANYVFDGKFQGKKILDLGCGSNSRIDSLSYLSPFEPWFCRLLYHLGADPIGVDIGNNLKERFKNHMIDLGKPGSLDFIADKSIDLVNAQQFFTSPYLEAVLKYDPREVEEILLPQIERVLKDDGCYVRLNY